jgi:hypothetical protein
MDEDEMKSMEQTIVQSPKTTQVAAGILQSLSVRLLDPGEAQRIKTHCVQGDR